MSMGSSSWKIRNEQKLTWKVLGTSSLPQFEKKASLKSEKKCRNHRQAEYHHTLKRKKNSVKCHARDSNLGPLVYEASVLPTEISFRMKNWEEIMTIYIWFIVQQMYVSLTYPFNIVQYTLSQIVEHRKLDSLATLDNIVWSTVTSVGPTMFVNLTPALAWFLLEDQMHVPNFGELSGSEDRGGGDNSIQFINFGRVGEKSFEEWRQKIGGGRVGDNNNLAFSSYCTR